MRVTSRQGETGDGMRIGFVGTGTIAEATVAVRQSAQDTANQTGQEITKRNVSIQPTLTIRPGFPMRVMVNKDLILRPYQPLFFQRGSSQ